MNVLDRNDQARAAKEKSELDKQAYLAELGALLQDRRFHGIVKRLIRDSVTETHRATDRDSAFAAGRRNGAKFYVDQLRRADYQIMSNLERDALGL